MRTTYHVDTYGVNRYAKLSFTRMGATMSDNIPTPPVDPPKADPPVDPPAAPTPTPAPTPAPPAPTPPAPSGGDANASELLAAISALPERVANAVREATPAPPADPPRAAENTEAKRKNLAQWWFGDR
jgi:hypothetical protein